VRALLTRTARKIGPSDYTLEKTVRAVPGITPRLVGENNEHAWRGYTYESIFETKPDDCGGIRPGRLRVVLRRHGRKRVLVVAGGSLVAPYGVCSASWRQAGRLMPGLRLQSQNAWHGLWFDAVRRRSWTRSYRIDVSWNSRRIGRRWLRVTHRVYPPHRIYANQDEEGFYHICEGAQTTQATRGNPYT
jgi:hypothetical protein